jgi:hypothetical protein
VIRTRDKSLEENYCGELGGILLPTIIVDLFAYKRVDLIKIFFDLYYYWV